MIVFNLFAIPIVLLVGAIGAGLIWLLPGIFGGPYETITYSLLAIGIGGLGEVIGLKGRLFFLPIWLIGGAVLTFQLWGLFGVLGLAAGGALLGLLAIAFVVTIVWSLRAAAQEMPQKIAAARALLDDGKVILAKPVLADAWVMPFFTALKPDQARQLSEVLSLLEQYQVGLAIRGDGPALVRGCRILLDRAVSQNLSYGFFSDECGLLGEVEPMLRGPDKWSLKEDHKESLAKVA